MFKKILIFSTILFAFLGMFVVKANDIEFTIGTLNDQETINIEDLVYNHYELQDGNNTHNIYNIEIGRYSDFDVVLHDRLFGDNPQGLSTVMEIALDYEAKTGKVVYAAINGDYFSGGLPVDFYCVENNILRIGPYSYTLGKNSFGFTNNHYAEIGKVDYGYKINILDSENNQIDYVPVNKVNASLSSGEIGVYTYNNTQSISGDNIAKLSVRFDKIVGNYAFPYIGSIISDVNDFVFNDTSYSVNYRDFVIAAKDESTSYQTLKNNITNDSRLSVYPYPINDWEGMDYIIGGWQVLLDNRNKLPDPIHDGGYSLAPRTSIGITGDGTIGLTVVDGRLTNVPGLNLEQLADLNEDLGYFTALELDGGGSSTFLLRNLETDTLEIMNNPSDGSLRDVANAVLIVGDPIEDEITTTETTTTEITTTTATTTTTDTETTSISTTTAVITSTAVTTETTSQITTDETTTTLSTTTGDVYESGCSSCENLNFSFVLIGFLTTFGFIFFRNKR